MDNVSYNTYLYQRRTEEKLSRHKFAKKLGISSFFYGLIEKGYLKPNQRQIFKISRALNINYGEYLEGASSYPEELPEEKRLGITDFGYHLLSFTWVKILFIILIGIFTSTMISGFQLENKVNSDSRQFYSEKYLNYFDAITENGSRTYTVMSEFTRPEIFVAEDHFLITIKGSYQSNQPSHVEYSAVYHMDDYRLQFKYSQGETILRANLYYYETKNSFQAVYGEPTKDSTTGALSYPIVSLYVQGSQASEGTTTYDAIKQAFELPDIKLYLSNLSNQFNVLIQESLHLNMSLDEDIFPELKMGGRKQQLLGVIALAMKIGGLILAAACLFVLCFCLIYGEKKTGVSLAQKEIISEKKEEAVHPQYKPLKKDWRLPALVPETILELIGIVMIFAGSLRVMYYFVVFMGSTFVSGNEFTEVPLAFFRVLLIGMFLLYYIDFDSFMNDKRILRCIFTYFIIYLALYGVEAIGFNWAENAQYLVLNIALPKVASSIPNNFSSITCYFLLMYFLFHRPTFIKTQKGKIAFRLLALIPIGIILFTTLVTLFQSDWGWNLDRNVLLLFKSEKPQFSVLCVTYLVLFYFLRLYYYHKLGNVNAERYFNGNKFIWQKNILVCLIVLVIALFELGFSENTVANSYGFGYYFGLIYLIPVLLFYHPHMGHRNTAVDWTTLGLYGLSFAFGYIIIGIVIFDAILNEGFSVENIMRYLGSTFGTLG